MSASDSALDALIDEMNHADDDAVDILSDMTELAMAPVVLASSEAEPPKPAPKPAPVASKPVAPKSTASRPAAPPKPPIEDAIDLGDLDLGEVPEPLRGSNSDEVTELAAPPKPALKPAPKVVATSPLAKNVHFAPRDDIAAHPARAQPAARHAAPAPKPEPAVREPEPEQEPAAEEQEPVRAPIAPARLVASAATARYIYPVEQMVDRCYGAFLGLALGDALGLPVKGDEPQTIAERHPGGPSLPCRGAFRGYKPCDWTDVTDNAVLVARAIANYARGETDDPTTDLAALLKRWYDSGFRELGDTAGLTPESVTLRSLKDPDFLSNPTEAARKVKGPKAENGALTRTLACAFTPTPAQWSSTMCAVTHADDRCLAASHVLTALVHRLAATRGAVDTRAGRRPDRRGARVPEGPAGRARRGAAANDADVRLHQAPDQVGVAGRDRAGGARQPLLRLQDPGRRDVGLPRGDALPEGRARPGERGGARFAPRARRSSSSRPCAPSRARAGTRRRTARSPARWSGRRWGARACRWTGWRRPRTGRGWKTRCAPSPRRWCRPGKSSTRNNSSTRETDELRRAYF